jgi:hypothetical protein
MMMVYANEFECQFQVIFSSVPNFVEMLMYNNR